MLPNFLPVGELNEYYPSDRRIAKTCKQLGSNLASECIRVPSCLQDSCKFFDSLARILQAYRFTCKILEAFRFILQDYLQDESKSLQDESKSLQESCKLFDSNAGKGGKHRKGEDFCSSKIVLALA